jgi:putative aldouronate transport system substrate-binding protein
MNRTAVRILVALLLVAAVVGSAFGEGQQTKETPTAKPGAGPAWKKDTSPITFDVYFNASWFAEPWGKGDSTTAYITKKTGVSINYIAPTGNEAEKVNTMIASGTLPDFFMVAWYDAGYRQAIEGKLVLPLNKLADQYDPWFYEVHPQSIRGWYTMDDGNIYGIPNFAYPPEKATGNVKMYSNKTFLVRKDMYEALGKPDLRTPEGFLAALKAAKEKFPTVNGQPLIPFGCHEFTDAGNDSFQSFLQDQLAIPRAADGRLYDRFSSPDYLRWMKTFRMANEMGLVSKDIFIDKRAQMEEKMAQGRYFSMMYQWTDLQTQNGNRYNTDPNSVYIAVDGPRNAKLAAPTLAGSGGLAGWEVTMISSKVRNAARAIAFLDYLFSPEGQQDQYLGEKGVSWDTIDGRDQIKPDVLALQLKDKNAFRARYLCAGELWTWFDPYSAAKWEFAALPPNDQPKNWTTKYAVTVAAFDDLDPAAGSAEGIIQKKLADKWGVLLPQLILAKSDAEFDTLWNGWIAERKALGWDKVIAFQQTRYLDHVKKLGLK